jgi:predicted CoA-substrate-specific enzyme activase
MTAYVMGIDFGSTTAKVVILDEDGSVVASAISQKGAVSDEGVRTALAEALGQAGIAQSAVGKVVSTGYGRRMLDIADRTITETTCHVRGVVSLVPDAQVAIDIGGQDSKVIAIDPNGLVARFAMNDRCAAGTGKFLEVLARAVNVDLEKMGGLALEAKETVSITSMCATFAETEVISLLAEGHSRPVVLTAVHQSIASRTVGLVTRVGKKVPVVMTPASHRISPPCTTLKGYWIPRWSFPRARSLPTRLAQPCLCWMIRVPKPRKNKKLQALEDDVEHLLAEPQHCAPACASKKPRPSFSRPEPWPG